MTDSCTALAPDAPRATQINVEVCAGVKINEIEPGRAVPNIWENQDPTP